MGKLSDGVVLDESDLQQQSGKNRDDDSHYHQAGESGQQGFEYFAGSAYSHGEVCFRSVDFVEGACVVSAGIPLHVANLALIPEGGLCKGSGVYCFFEGLVVARTLFRVPTAARYSNQEDLMQKLLPFMEQMEVY